MNIEKVTKDIHSKVTKIKKFKKFEKNILII